MATVLTLIEDAYDDIGIKKAETNLTESEINKGIRYYNRVISSFDAFGIHLNGVSKAADSSTDSRVPDWAEALVVSYMAISLAPAFSRPVSKELAAVAEKAYADVKAATWHPLTSTPHPNLPRGSGNHGQHYRYMYNRFFNSGGFWGYATTLSDNHGHSLTDNEGHTFYVD